MPTVVGISLRRASKVYHFSPGRLTDLQPGEYVIVDTSRGSTMGRVVCAPREVPQSAIKAELKPVLRRATSWDAVQQDLHESKEPEVLERTREIVDRLRLEMKVVAVEYSYDGGHITVYFSAESRIDFRALVKELAKVFRSSVEMRQIGVRDEAKMLDGYGRCGYRLCCASWMQEFAPVSIRLAKVQDLPLNPAEISGTCGRLLCCLSFESRAYAEALDRLPARKSRVLTPKGEGTVVRVHPLKETVTVVLDGTETLLEVPVGELVAESPVQQPQTQAQPPRRRGGRGRRRSD
jgi:cell fate regulator YaaT (PSP1 superfamily)